MSLELIKQKEKECNAFINSASDDIDENLFCKRTWDGISCWNDTKAGVTESKECPDYMYLSTTSGDPVYYVTRKCEDNGTWEFNVEYNKTWSDYQDCLKSPPLPYQLHDKILQILYTVGYTLSIIALVVAIIIFLHFRKLRCPRNTIHMHFFVSFILRAILLFIRDIMQANVTAHIKNDQTYTSESYQTPFCKLAFTLMQYFLVTNYYWLLVEGVYLHSLITLAVFSGRTNLKYYFVLGWGFPAIIVFPWAIHNIVTKEKGCWWENITTNRSYWIIKTPVMLSILVNFVLFLNITRVLATKLRASNAAEARVYSKLAKSTLVLIPIFGVYYIVTVGMHASNDQTVTLVRMYVDLIISPFQGVIMAILYCFLNGDVQAELRRKWKLHQINRTLSTNMSVATRTTAHSRSSGSTPPRKESMGDGNGNERHCTTQRFSVIGRIISLKSRLFHSKRRKGQMNGSVGNHKGAAKTKQQIEDEKAKHVLDLSAVEEDNPTETTKLQSTSSNKNNTNSNEKKNIASDEDELLKDDDSGHVPSGDSKSPSLNDEATEQKKEVHFAPNIETEV